MNPKRFFALTVIILLMTFISASYLSAATYYVSSSSGNNSNHGISPSSPWQTISKVNSRSFSPGDSILFKRGDTWINDPLTVPSSGLQGNIIYFGAYGTGNLPKLDGGNQEYWQGLVRIDGKSWITLENLEITNVGKQCLSISATSATSTGVTIQNCEIHKNNYFGYMLIYVDAGGVLGRVTQLTINNNLIYDGLHDGIRLTGGVTYTTISNNIIHTFFHNGIDSYPGSVNNSNFTVNGNNIYNVKCGIYFPGMSYASIYDNLIHDDWKGSPSAGYDAMSYGIKIDSNVRASDHITVRNNVIWDLNSADNNTYAVWISNTSYSNLWNNTVFGSHNTLLNLSNSNLNNHNNLAYDCTYDTGGWVFGSDPKFVNPMGSPPDFNLQPDSKAIDAGVDIGLPYFGTAPDLGAYEHNPKILTISFEEGNGTYALDSSGYNNHGSIYGGATYTTDSAVASYALSFDGIDDRIVVKGYDYLKPSTISVSLWVKHMKDTTSSYGGILQGSNGDGYYYGFRILDYQNKPLLQINFGDGSPKGILGNPFQLGEWSHVAFTYDGQNIKLYQNGQLIQTVPESRNINWNKSNSDLYIGWAQWHFSGIIDEIKMFNYALSSQEVNQLYNELNEILFITFEEGNGITALDSSGYNNHGSIYGGAAYTTESAVGSYALSFDGIDGRVAVKGYDYLKTSTISVSLWVKHMKDTTSSYGGILQGPSGNGYDSGFRILDYQNRPFLQINFGDGSPKSILGNPFSMGEWCHVTFTYDGQYIRLYQNNKLIRAVKETRNINWKNGNTDLYIGWAQWYFTGMIDEIKIYNYASSTP